MESEVDLKEETLKATTIASKTSFKAFSLLLEKVNKIDESNASLAARGGIGKNEEKKRTLEDFMDKWRSSGLKNPSLDKNFFPVMRLLLPADDRRVYGLKEFRLAKYLIDALCIAPKSDDALKLLNYRAPSNVKSDGDFASVAYFVLKNRCRDDLTLTIEEVNFHLDNISTNNAKGKEGQKEVNSSIQKLLVNLSAIQLKWLIRIILKDLKIGIKEHTILEAYHPDAMDLYNFSSSLEKVCDMLNDPHKRLHEVGVCVFSPCRPMLGEKAKPTKIESLLGGNSFYIETKFDGERFQLHKSKDKYVYFSRNGHDYTDVFGSDIYSGSLTPFIHSSFSNDIQTIILDGEMCGYNAKENILLSVSEAYDVKSNARYYEDIQTCFCVFDILLYNDEVLTNKPLKERIEYLKKSFKEIDGRIIFSQQELAHSNQHVVDALNRAIDSRLEGIVVKNPDSVYKPSVRSGSGWYKVKPDYMLGLNDDLDLLIVGAYYGTGRRSGLLSHFLLAVAFDEEKSDNNKKTMKSIEMDDELDFEGKNENNEEVCLPKTFYSFCKIGSGYTLKELYDFNQKLSDKWVKYDKKNPPAHLQLTYEKPDVWIDPKHSLIVQVKAVEISASDKYKTNCTLRFPRLEKFRPDKQWHECMKFSELKELRDKNEGKLASGKHFDLEDYDEDGNFIAGEENDEPLIKRKKKSLRTAKTPTVNARFRGIDSSTVNKIADLFDDKEFCIIMGNDKYDKLTLERKVAELGGMLVQNPGPDTFCIITSKLIHKVNPYITKNLYDVVKVEWLIKCIENRKLMPFKKSDLFHCSKKETKDYLNTNYDLYGDSYTEDLTVDSLKELFQTMSNTEFDAPFNVPQNRNQLRSQIATLENKYFPDESYKFGLFRLCNIYLDCHELVESKDGTMVECKKKTNSLDLVGLKVRWRGGQLANLIDENTTHCVLDKMNLESLNKLKKLNTKRSSKFHIVSSEWIMRCIEANRLVNELPFHL